MGATLLLRRRYDAGELASRFPPVWEHPHKAAIHDQVQLPEPTGTVEVTRWAPAPRDLRLPTLVPEVEIRSDYFTYEPDQGDWHLNFADADLFGAYGSSLLAQDELQVLEHPILASILEAWNDEGLPAMPCEDGRATPVLVRGAERRLALRLEPDASQGRPRGLYGNAFARASLEAVLNAVEPIDPPTLSNILAIEAPSYGTGRYSRGTLRFVIETAATGFAAAKLETPSDDCTIHTGFWGCGAYGGNRAAMTQLQMVAARAAGIPRIVFHAGQAPGVVEDAIAQLAACPAWRKAETNEKEVVEAIFEFAHQWGESDGN